MKKAALTVIGGEAPTNDAAEIIGASEPYSVIATLRGSAPLLMHFGRAYGASARVHFA